MHRFGERTAKKRRRRIFAKKVAITQQQWNKTSHTSLSHANSQTRHMHAARQPKQIKAFFWQCSSNNNGRGERERERERGAKKPSLPDA